MESIHITKQKVSIIVPVYNEFANLKVFHRQLVKSLRGLRSPYEIVYVDDNSTDGTFEYLLELSKSSDVRVFQKEGKRGKAYSLMQGFSRSTGSILVMIDGDLQYPPSAIPYMVHQLNEADIIVADREYSGSGMRKFMSKTFRSFFGKVLFGLPHDVQSGLKVFYRTVYETVSFTPSSAWSFDLEFLHRARVSGFTIANYSIPFAQRKGGDSKISIFRAGWELLFHSFRVRLKRVPPLMIPPTDPFSMRGSGIGHKQKKYISHTTLPFTVSAFHTFTPVQKLIGISVLLILTVGLFLFPLSTARVVVTLLSVLYFIDTLFNLFLVWKSVRKEEELRFKKEELDSLTDDSLPVYTILCPLYKEAHVIPQFVHSISQLEWPKEKLDVMLLLEEDDIATIDAVGKMDLPSFVRSVVVPHSFPKTKPKACNYGLSFAKGEYLVIYDAEDMPDPLQLKKAYLGFQKSPSNVRCLQAKLNYYNPRQNLLTRFFTAEYSLWFDLTLTGLQSFRSTIPLGGTSNHFKTQDLRDLQGWDPFNVTEDADLGVRLFQEGYQTAIIDSTTLEEANSQVKNWIRQRSRWIKGYMQTYLVHMRDFSSFVKKKGLKHNLIFQLTVGGKLLFILLNPFLWVVTLLYFGFHSYFAPVIELIYVPPVSYIAVFSWVFGNFLFLYYYMIGCAKRNEWDIVKYVYFIPIYWLMMSYSAMVAFYQLLFKPHYWEKTVHGLHLKKKVSEEEIVAPSNPLVVQVPTFEEVIQNKKESPASDYFQSIISRQLLTKAFIAGISLLTFLLLDVLLVTHFFDSYDVFQYLSISILGKATFLLSQLLGLFISFSLYQKMKVKSIKKAFNNFVFFVFIFSWSGFVLFGLEGGDILPVVFNMSFSSLANSIPLYMFAVMCFSLVNVFVLYNLRKGVYTFAVVSLLMNILEGLAIYYSHSSLSTVVRHVAYASSADLLLVILLHVNTQYIRVLENNLRGLFGLFHKASYEKAWQENNLRILIMNWRDTKHIYAGGAEVYIHELSKRWVKDGNKVTVFCGNDQRNPSYEVIDGVEVIRRGGTYTVYLFAFFYYVLKFRGKYDLIIDCENGIPFFAPLYIRKPIVLLIHHVHQEIFRVFLKFPFSYVAKFMESTLMPTIYRDMNVVTVSDSSREEIFKLGFTHSRNIDIIYNGVAENPHYDYGKTAYPSFIYLGRLKKYKHVEVAISAFSQVVKKHPTARLSIVGTGECFPELSRLVKSQGLTESVTFYGKVSEEEKARLLAQSWVALQPSQIEGWGITVLESNAAGTPVIASRVNGLKDSVVDGKTGILVEHGNVGAFVREMNNLIEQDDYRQALTEAAYAWSKSFSWDKSAVDFYQLIGRSLRIPQIALEAAYAKLLLQNPPRS